MPPTRAIWASIMPPIDQLDADMTLSHSIMAVYKFLEVPQLRKDWELALKPGMNR